MPSKRKKPDPAPPRRVYSTREIMEITEQRRRKQQQAPPKEPVERPAPVEEELPLPEAHLVPAQEETLQESAPAMVKEELPLPDDKPALVEELSLPEKGPVLIEGEVPLSEDPSANVLQTNEEMKKSIFSGAMTSGRQPVNLVQFRFLFVALAAMAFLIGFFNFPQDLKIMLADKLNGLIIYAGFLILHLVQGPCSLQGSVISTPYYKISMQGDLVAFYSLAVLTVFAAFLTFRQENSWFKRVMIFIDVIPLVLVAGVLRILCACGLAFNYGPSFADRYFHGALAAVVLIFGILGLVFFEFLFASE